MACVSETSASREVTAARIWRGGSMGEGGGGYNSRGEKKDQLTSRFGASQDKECKPHDCTTGVYVDYK